MSKRCILIVLDSVGIGEMPDAKQYGDEGSNTLGNIYKVCDGMDIPNLISLGLGNIEGGEILGHTTSPKASYGKAKELSKGKDTVTGHWEISGVVLKTPLTTYPNGFPEDIIK